MTPTPWDADSEHLLRELAPQVLGAVIRRLHDFASAEDAVQEALIAAVMQWPQEGVPENPRGWLIQVASRRMTDQLRRETARRRRETAVALEAETVVPAVDLQPEMDQRRRTDSAIHVLPPGTHFLISDCPDITGGRRLDDRRNCSCIPGP